MIKILDVRSVPPVERHPQIFKLFDALDEGDSFILVNDHDPRPLFYQFKAERSDIFGWDCTQAGPIEWRIEIHKLKPKDSETRIGAYFERDHDEIDLLFGYLRRDVQAAAGDPRRPLTPLARQFEEFDSRLERHIRWEEEVLFPEVERKSPSLAFGPGRVMRTEHVDIRRLKAEAGEMLHSRNPDLKAAARLLDACLHVLAGHNEKEEQIYYPMSDQMFSPAEAASILERVRNVGR